MRARDIDKHPLPVSRSQGLEVEPTIPEHPCLFSVRPGAGSPSFYGMT
jgi:hypothetical protein